MTSLEEVRALAAELVSAFAAVKQEMDAAGARGELRTNGQMPAWPRYQQAQQAWNALATTLAQSQP